MRMCEAPDTGRAGNHCRRWGFDGLCRLTGMLCVFFWGKLVRRYAARGRGVGAGSKPAQSLRRKTALTARAEPLLREGSGCGAARHKERQEQSPCPKGRQRVRCCAAEELLSSFASQMPLPSRGKLGTEASWDGSFLGRWFIWLYDFRMVTVRFSDGDCMVFGR
jgi:hypothetical protein